MRKGLLRSLEPEALKRRFPYLREPARVLIRSLRCFLDQYSAMDYISTRYRIVGYFAYLCPEGIYRAVGVSYFILRAGAFHRYKNTTDAYKWQAQLAQDV